jgi:hypothetical protein
MLLYIG